MKDPRIHYRDLWDRPSMDMKVRPSKVERDIGRNDLTIVRGPGSPKMLAGTLARRGRDHGDARLADARRSS